MHTNSQYIVRTSGALYEQEGVLFLLLLSPRPSFLLACHKQQCQLHSFVNVLKMLTAMLQPPPHLFCFVLFCFCLGMPLPTSKQPPEIEEEEEDTEKEE